MSVPSNYAIPANSLSLSGLSSAAQPANSNPTTLTQSISQPVLSNNQYAHPSIPSSASTQFSNINVSQRSTTTPSATTAIELTSAEQQFIRQIDQIYNNTTDKINSELIAMTYGVFISSVCNDMCNNINDINNELYSIGENIGVRIIDEFIAKTQSTVGYQCDSFRDVIVVLCKLAFKYYLGINCDIIQYTVHTLANQSNVTNPTNNHNIDANTNTTLHSTATVIIQFFQCPLFTFVDLPDDMIELRYGNIICGIITAALQQLNISVQCNATKHEFITQHNGVNEITIDLIEIIKENYVANDE